MRDYLYFTQCYQNVFCDLFLVLSTFDTYFYFEVLVLNNFDNLKKLINAK